MKIVYDQPTDTLTVVLRPEPVAESDEVRDGVILDYDAAGQIVGLELLHASRYIAQPETFSYELKPVTR